MPNPREGEKAINAYIRSGCWRFVRCSSPSEANDFQWYVIDQLSPSLNIHRCRWHEDTQIALYGVILPSLIAAQLYTYKDFPRGIDPPWCLCLIPRPITIDRHLAQTLCILSTNM